MDANCIYCNCRSKKIVHSIREGREDFSLKCKNHNGVQVKMNFTNDELNHATIITKNLRIEQIFGKNQETYACDAYDSRGKDILLPFIETLTPENAEEKIKLYSPFI